MSDRRARFMRVLWGALALYEILNFLFLSLLRALPPPILSRELLNVAEGAGILVMILPLWLVLSFREILPRVRILSRIFFLWYFILGAFWIGAIPGMLLVSLARGSRSTYPGLISESALAGGLLLTGALFVLSLRARFLPPRIIRKTLTFDGLDPRLSGTTILHLSDLHVGAWQGEARLRTFAGMVRDLSPDILAITGDVVDHREEEGEIFERIFSPLSGRIGTVAVLGNHEYWTLEEGAAEVMRRHGYPLLKNESRLLVTSGGGEIRVVGIDDPAGADYESDCGPDLDKALSGVRAGEFVLALVHQPTLWEGRLCESAHLTLSGHTHGGQIGWHPPFPNLASLFFRHSAGLFPSSAPASLGHFLHVSAGLGYYGIPVRVGMVPEMTLLTLLPTPKKG